MQTEETAKSDLRRDFETLGHHMSTWKQDDHKVFRFSTCCQHCGLVVLLIMQNGDWVVESLGEREPFSLCHALKGTVAVEPLP
jgi:hypothetical protein